PPLLPHKAARGRGLQGLGDQGIGFPITLHAFGRWHPVPLGTFPNKARKGRQRTAVSTAVLGQGHVAGPRTLRRADALRFAIESEKLTTEIGALDPRHTRLGEELPRIGM